MGLRAAFAAAVPSLADPESCGEESAAGLHLLQTRSLLKKGADLPLPAIREENLMEGIELLPFTCTDEGSADLKEPAPGPSEKTSSKLTLAQEAQEVRGEERLGVALAQVHASISEDGQTARVSFQHEGISRIFDLEAREMYSEDGKVARHTEHSGVVVEEAVSAGRPQAFRVRAADGRQHAVALISLVQDGSATTASVQGIFRDGDDLLVRLEPQLEEEDGDSNALLQTRTELQGEQEGGSSLHTIKELPWRVILSGIGGASANSTAEHHPKTPKGFQPQAVEARAVPREFHDGEWNGTPFFPGCYPGDKKMYSARIRTVADVAAFNRFPDIREKIEGTVLDASFVFEHQFNFELKIGLMDIYESDATAPVWADSKWEPTEDWGHYNPLFWNLVQMKDEGVCNGFFHAHLFSGVTIWSNDHHKKAISQVYGKRSSPMCADQWKVAETVFPLSGRDGSWRAFAKGLASNLGSGSTNRGGIQGYGDGKFEGEYQWTGPYKPGYGYDQKWMCETLTESRKLCEKHNFGPVKKSNKPEYPGGWYVKKGDCYRDITDPSCILSSGFPDADYEGKQKCIIKLTDKILPISVDAFEVDVKDYLKVNGKAYKSGKGYKLQGMVPTKTVVWKTDKKSKGGSGWKICRRSVVHHA